MKLQTLESDILAAVTLHADASVDKIAKLVGCRPHSCRYALDRLLQKRVIARRVVINPGRLGYQNYGLWFSVSGDCEADISQIVRALVAAPNVSYVGEYSGEYEWRIDILARSLTEVDQFISAFAKKFEYVLAARRLICTLSIRDYSLKSLSGRVKDSSVICIEFPQETIQISEVDHRLLSEIAADGNLSQPALSRKLGIPVSTVSFRLNSLREKEIIVGTHMLPEVESLRSYDLSFRLHRIHLTQPDDKVRKALLKFAAEDPSVYGLTLCIGDSDAEICSATKSVAEERHFDVRLKKELGKHIASHSTLRAIKHHKVNLYPFQSK